MTGSEPEVEGTLHAVLIEAQRRGSLGPTPVTEHVRHALGFALAAGSPAPVTMVDLGAGGGVPALPLLVGPWRSTRAVLLDAAARRCRQLEADVARLGLSGRVTVLHARAEEAAHRSELRSAADVVVARSFGPPAVTIECAAGLVAPGGAVVISEPPGGRSWPADALAALGLRAEARVRAAGAGFLRARMTGSCPPGTPRRSGVPERRPLF